MMFPSPYRSIGCFGLAIGLGVIALHAKATPADSAAGSALPPVSTVLSAPPDNPDDLLKIDAAMQEYFDRRLTAVTGSRELLQEIVDTILAPTGLGFVYDAEITSDPRETFRQRRGNCVSFAFLVVAIARKYGFDARFQNVEVTPRWDRFGTLVASIVHINVRVESTAGTSIVDLRPDLVPRFDPEVMHPIRDDRAFAEFYSNVGFFRLARGNTAQGMYYLRHATEIDGTYAVGWSNLGTAYLRMGDLNAARQCFERSYRKDHSGVASLVGLVAVLRRIGTPDAMREAAKYDRRAERMREQNPYYLQHLAQEATERSDWAAAEKHLRRAIRIKDDEPEFYAQLITTLQRLGRNKDAERAEQTLDKLLSRRPRPITSSG